MLTANEPAGLRGWDGVGRKVNFRPGVRRRHRSWLCAVANSELTSDSAGFDESPIQPGERECGRGPGRRRDSRGSTRNEHGTHDLAGAANLGCADGDVLVECEARESRVKRVTPPPPTPPPFLAFSFLFFFSIFFFPPPPLPARAGSIAGSDRREVSYAACSTPRRRGRRRCAGRRASALRLRDLLATRRRARSSRTRTP